MGRTYLSGLRVLLVLGVADGTVLLDDHGPTASALAQVPAVLLGELGVGVTEQEEVLALGNLKNLAPAVPVSESEMCVYCRCLVRSVHDKGVVESDEGELVDTLGLQLRPSLSERRQVVGGAGGGEGACSEPIISIVPSIALSIGMEELTGKRDEDNLLALPLLRGIVLLGETANGRVLVEDRSPAVVTC